MMEGFGEFLDNATILELIKRRMRQLDVNCKFLIDAVEVIHMNLCPEGTGTWQDKVKQAVAASIRMKVKKPDNNNDPLYYYANGKVYDKKCYNCGVEWLDDQCSTEQARCDSCKIDGIYTKWEVNKWGLDNNQLTVSDNKIVFAGTRMLQNQETGKCWVEFGFILKDGTFIHTKGG